MGVDYLTKSCPFCGSENLKLETKRSKNVTLEERYAGYKVRIVGSIRCNKCFSRGPTCHISSKNSTLNKVQQLLLENMAYDNWNKRANW